MQKYIFASGHDSEERLCYAPWQLCRNWSKNAFLQPRLFNKVLPKFILAPHFIK
jgi:hypothetical protein